MGNTPCGSAGFGSTRSATTRILNGTSTTSTSTPSRTALSGGCATGLIRHFTTTWGAEYCPRTGPEISRSIAGVLASQQVRSVPDAQPVASSPDGAKRHPGKATPRDPDFACAQSGLHSSPPYGLYSMSIKPRRTSAAESGALMYLYSSACLRVSSRPLTSVSCSDVFG